MRESGRWKESLLGEGGGGGGGVANQGNHLGVPKPENNPNLLSPEILQRRGKTIIPSEVKQWRNTFDNTET
jgi:hypothetical protein